MRPNGFTSKLHALACDPTTRLDRLSLSLDGPYGRDPTELQTARSVFFIAGGMFERFKYRL